MKKQSKKETVLVKGAVASAIAMEFTRPWIKRPLAHIVLPDGRVDHLRIKLAGCPMVVQRAAVRAVVELGHPMEDVIRGAKGKAEKIRAEQERVAREERKAREQEVARIKAERAKGNAESEVEKAFAEKLEKLNARIEMETDPEIRELLLEAIPMEPGIVAAVKTRKEKTEKTTTKTPKTENRKELLEKALPGTVEEISTRTGVDKLTISKYVTAYTKEGKGWKKTGKVISIAV